MNKIKSIKTYLLFVGMVGCLAACSNARQEKNDKLFKVMEEGLVISNGKLDNHAWRSLIQLDQRLEDPATKEMMQYWHPTILKADSLSNNLDKYFVSLKDSVVTGKVGGISKQQSTEIYRRLKFFKEKMLWIDSSVASEFKCCFIITTASFDSTSKTDDDFYNTFFSGNSIVANSVVLTKFQNNIKNRQNETMDFLLQRSSGCGMGWTYDSYKVLVSQSATHVRPNEKFEVHAGIGAFSARANPRITVNGISKRDKTPEGDNVFYLNAASKPGKYINLVNIRYLGMDGKTVNVERELFYYVDSIPTKQ